MFLYNESGKKFEIDDSRENMINHGCCGEIYKYKTIVLNYIMVHPYQMVK